MLTAIKRLAQFRPDKMGQLAPDCMGTTKPESMDQCDRILHQRTDYTIKRLNLNFESLKEARKQLWKTCFLLIEEIIVLLKQEKKVASKARQQKIKDKMRQLWQYSRTSSPFSATVKTCLQSSGYDWAIKIAA